MNYEYIYGIGNIKEHVSFLDCTRFGFELFNQKMFEIKKI
jgi:hypothetical protein